jgi:hypothetical protein
MAPPPVRGLYHLTLVGEQDGQITQNGFYFQGRDGNPNDTNLEDAEHLAGDFQEWILPLIKAIASDEWHLKGLVVTTLIPRLGPLVEVGILNEGGIQGNGSLPSYSAGVLSLRTGFSGRSNRGRLYFAGVPKGDCLNSRVGNDYITGLQAVGNGLLERYGPFGTNTRLLYGLYRRRIGDIRHSEVSPVFIEQTQVGFAPITQTIARRELYTMRKRLLGKGV